MTGKRLGWLLFLLSSCRGGGPPPEALDAIERGIAYLELSRPALAVEAFREATHIAPRYTPAVTNLGLALYYAGQDEEAAGAMERALALADPNPRAHYLLGLMALDRDDAERAKRELRAALRTSPHDPMLHYFLGRSAYREGEWEEAEQAWQRSLELYPDLRPALYGLGRLYLRLRKPDQAMPLLKRHQALAREDGQEMGRGRRYNFQGDLALAWPPPRARGGLPGEPTEPTAVRVHLEELPVRHSGGLGELEPLPGSALCPFDADGDGWTDLYFLDAHPAGQPAPNQLWRWTETGLTPATQATGLEDAGQGRSCTVGDFDNDGFPDVYLVNRGEDRLFRNLGSGRFKPVKFGDLPATGPGLGATWIDLDRDGHLDLVLLNEDRLRFFFNRRAEGFQEGQGFQHLMDQPPSALLAVDLDGDLNLELYLAGPETDQVLRREEGDWKVLETLPGGPVVALDAADLDGDGDLEFLRLGPAVDRSRILWNQEGRLSPAPVPIHKDAEIPPTSAGTLVDLDLDGDQDLLLVVDGRQAERPMLSVWEWTGQSFANATARFGLTQSLAGSPGGVALTDLGSDGTIDVVLYPTGGRATVLRFTSPPSRHWLGFRLHGVGSNRLGLGSQIEVKAGSTWQRRQVTEPVGLLLRRDPSIPFGLGSSQEASLVRVIWPSGLRQPQLDVAGDQRIDVEEAVRKSSCPLLFAWNGNQFLFITDFLGAGFLGIPTGPDTYFQPDSDEFVRLPEQSLGLRGTSYRLKVVEALEEVNYLDRAALLAVDHPAGTALYPHERLKMTPPPPEHRFFLLSSLRPAGQVWTESGKDVTEIVRDLDRRYLPLRLLPYHGLAQPHGLTIDLGDLPAGRTVLVLDGWIEYWNSQSVREANRDGVSLIIPRLEVPAEEGGWRTAIPDLGFPAGLPKPMTVDLTGLLNPQDPRVRIVTNLEVYWDRIRVGIAAPAPPPVVRKIPLEAARLSRAGYPAMHLPDGRNPPVFLYGERAPDRAWGRPAGYYTRFGDVRTLLADTDDQFVIFGPGEEVDLVFDAATLAPPAPGQVRTFLFFADGYVKDMLPGTAYPLTVAPLPYHAMPGFPYPLEERSLAALRVPAFGQEAAFRWRE